MWQGFKFLKFGYFQKFYAASIQFGLVFKRSMFFCSFLNEFDCIFNCKFCSELLETNFLSGVSKVLYIIRCFLLKYMPIFLRVLKVFDEP